MQMMSTILSDMRAIKDTIISDHQNMDDRNVAASTYGEDAAIFDLNNDGDITTDELDISDAEIYARLLADEDRLTDGETNVADNLDQLFAYNEGDNCYTLDKATIEEITGTDMGKAWAIRGVQGMYGAIFDTELPQKVLDVTSSKGLQEVEGYQTAEDGYAAVVGDVVFMSNPDGSNSHSGMVVGVYGDKVAVMEFNSDNANGGGAIVLYDINGKGKSIRGGINFGQENMPNLLGDNAFGGLEETQAMQALVQSAKGISESGALEDSGQVATTTGLLKSAFLPDGDPANAKTMSKEEWAEITGSEYPKGWALAGSKDALAMIHGEDNYAVESVLSEINKSSDIPKAEEYVDLTNTEETARPQVGDLVYTDNAKGGNAHNGVVLSIDEEAGTYQVLEFNSDDANGGATVVTYSINSDTDKSIKGFISLSDTTYENTPAYTLSTSDTMPFDEFAYTVENQVFTKAQWAKITGNEYSNAWALDGAKDALGLIHGQDNEILQQSLEGITTSSSIQNSPYYVPLEENAGSEIEGSLVFTSNPDGTNPHCGILLYANSDAGEYTVLEFNSDDANGGATTVVYGINSDTDKSIQGYISRDKVEELNNLIMSSDLTEDNGFYDVQVVQHNGKTAVQYELDGDIYIAYVADDFSEIDTYNAIRIK